MGWLYIQSQSAAICREPREKSLSWEIRSSSYCIARYYFIRRGGLQLKQRRTPTESAETLCPIYWLYILHTKNQTVLLLGPQSVHSGTVNSGTIMGAHRPRTDFSSGGEVKFFNDTINPCNFSMPCTIFLFCCSIHLSAIHSHFLCKFLTDFFLPRESICQKIKCIRVVVTINTAP